MSETIPLRCESCGNIHWPAAPALRLAFDALADAGRLTPATLAERIGGSRNRASGLLNRLVSEGLAEKRPVESETPTPGPPRVEYLPT